jgi:Kdo2-lipid IVA lauroyltransferase/acyltransferase
MSDSKAVARRRRERTRALSYYTFILPMQRLVQLLPSSAATRLGGLIGLLMFRIVRRYREVALRNLASAFEWGPQQTERVARETFRNLGKTLVEFLRLPVLSAAEIRRICRLEGTEYVTQELTAGRGVIIITAHYGNWELFAARVAIDGVRLNVVAREADDAATNALVNGIREGCGYRVIPRQSAARGVLEALRRNEVVVLMMDQNTIAGGEFVPFFDRLAATVTGPAVFALRTGAAIVPAFAVRQPDGTHVGRVLPPFVPIRTGDRAEDVRMLTAHLTAVIEAQVRADPTQWFWIHDRWRHRPPDERLARKEVKA